MTESQNTAARLTDDERMKRIMALPPEQIDLLTQIAESLEQENTKRAKLSSLPETPGDAPRRHEDGRVYGCGWSVFPTASVETNTFGEVNLPDDVFTELSEISEKTRNFGVAVALAGALVAGNYVTLNMGVKDWQIHYELLVYDIARVLNLYIRY